MKIQSFKELTKLLKLCQAHGVVAVEVDGMKLSILPKTKAIARQAPIDLTTFVEESIPVPQYNGVSLPDEVHNDSVKAEELTEQQLMFYSSSSTEETVEQ